MRILHLSTRYSPRLSGGAERMATALAEEQASRGHDVAVATLTQAPQRPRTENGVFVYGIGHASFFLDDWTQYSPPVRYVNKFLEGWNPIILHRVRAVISSFKPDVVHSHSMVNFSVNSWRAAAERQIPIIHTLHDYNLFCRNSTAHRNGKMCGAICLACRVTEPKRWLSRLISAVVGVSNDVLQRHLARGLFQHIPRERRWVIKNPPWAFAKSHPIKSPDTPFTIGFIGKVSPEKGIWDLLDAASGLPETGWQLLIAGDLRREVDRAALHARCAGLPITWLGFVPTEAFFSKIDLLVVPSTWAEPGALVVNEALASGIPIVGSRIGGIPEMIEDGVTGWIFEPGNVDDLRKTLATRITAGRDALPQPASFASIQSEITIRRVADKYGTIYEALL